MASAAEQLAANFNFSAFLKPNSRNGFGLRLARLLSIGLAPISRCPESTLRWLQDVFSQQAGGIIGMFDMFAGGALGRMSIFALNIMPYILRRLYYAADDGGLAALPGDEERG